MPGTDHGLGSYEYGGQTWYAVPWVIRKREVRLVHELADTVDGYRCRWPNTLDDNGEYRTSPVYGITKDRATGVMEKSGEQGIHTGWIQMHLTPGQDPAGEVRCVAWRYDPPETRTQEGYKAWKVSHPNEEPTMLVSDWSNPRPVGVVEPDPVPEANFLLGIILGVVALAGLAKLFRRNH